jgi:hypothetical protein
MITPAKIRRNIFIDVVLRAVLLTSALQSPNYILKFGAESLTIPVLAAPASGKRQMC